jgi:DNA-binding CsgD family transcriptional regulator
MCRQSKPPSANFDESVPPLPIGAQHWGAIIEALELSPQQARVLELTLRGMSDKQIAATLGISEPTLRTYLSRISARTRTRGRMELAMRVWAVSREVDSRCH